MEAVVDMTPRLRIPSSFRKEQRSLSPSLSLSFSLPPLKCVTLFFYLPALSLTAAAAFTSFLFHPFPQPPSHTPKHTHTHWNDLWHLKKSRVFLHVPQNNDDPHAQTGAIALTNTSILTPLCLHIATHWCTGRSSTPTQHDGAPLLMPSGIVVRHKTVQHLWSPAGQRSSSGPTQTLDLRRKSKEFEE